MAHQTHTLCIGAHHAVPVIIIRVGPDLFDLHASIIDQNIQPIEHCGKLFDLCRAGNIRSDPVKMRRQVIQGHDHARSARREHLFNEPVSDAAPNPPDDHP